MESDSEANYKKTREVDSSGLCSSISCGLASTAVLEVKTSLAPVLSLDEGGFPSQLRHSVVSVVQKLTGAKPPKILDHTGSASFGTNIEFAEPDTVTRADNDLLLAAKAILGGQAIGVYGPSKRGSAEREAILAMHVQGRNVQTHLPLSGDLLIVSTNEVNDECASSVVGIYQVLRDGQIGEDNFSVRQVAFYEPGIEDGWISSISLERENLILETTTGVKHTLQIISEAGQIIKGRLVNVLEDSAENTDNIIVKSRKIEIVSEENEANWAIAV